MKPSNSDVITLQTPTPPPSPPTSKRNVGVETNVGGNGQAELDARAQALRSEGLTYREVGERMGERTKQAWVRCNREVENANTRRYKERHREHVRAYGRAYSDANRARCPRCGHVYGKGSATKSGLQRHITLEQCPGCIHQRRELVVRRWAEGVKMKDIATELGWTTNHLGAEIIVMRKGGWDLPYRNRGYGSL